ncbi:hypothetical protein PbB2_02295 [Candidatus Phycosocius bacilliformis]|uniref:Uncharacterized protein n=1 Tax=Candidatus Phycosocius bacilliformis TaxID=1445552 RepID=A0A2P2EC20_9PROT|nr:hypothetical protein PbB2_02295 [Candidatus Phycosocius bacilliformis]
MRALLYIKASKLNADFIDVLGAIKGWNIREYSHGFAVSKGSLSVLSPSPTCPLDGVLS